jgi:hypothetical protein
VAPRRPLAHQIFGLLAKPCQSDNLRMLADVYQPEQRRAERRRPGALRVDLDSGRTGTLLNLSEYGALLDLPLAGSLQTQLSFDLRLETGPVRLHGRVVRSTPHYDPMWRIEWLAPVSYHVAIEFIDLTSQCVTTLQQLLLKAAAATTKGHLEGDA